MKLNIMGLAGALILAATLQLPALAATKAARVSFTPVTANELKSIYGDRTWVWKTGGGRFEDSGNRFLAYTREGGKPSIGQGSWAVDDNGKLCLYATWSTRDGAKPAATCFGHVKAGGTIYQRRFPFGHWYVFRHASVRKGDEIRKLITADTVSANVRQWQATASRRDGRN